MKVNQIRSQAGFTLIEALVALIVMGFGMLALAGMQMTLSRNADIAKQRTEAMRLAQDKMEALRSFTGLSADAAKIDWTDLVNGNDSISSYVLSGTTLGSTNTTFTRRWTLGGASGDPQRAINVTVKWNDRSGEEQTVNLASVVARVDPRDAGVLAYPLPENTNLKRPKNRNLNIPIQANPIPGTDSSYYKLGGGISVVFSNVTGYVVQRCRVSDPTAENLADKVNVCPVYNAFILAGYVSGAVSIDSTHKPTMPTGINVTGISGSDPQNPITCLFGQATDQNNTSSSSPTYIPNYDYYLCVIPMSSSIDTWSGVVRLGGVPNTGSYKVCRVQYAASDFVNDNERNNQGGTRNSPTGYTNVNESLDNQNYYIDSSGSADCPTIGTNVTGVTGGTVATVVHQDCRLSVPLATSGPTGTCPAMAYDAPASAP